MFYCLMKFGIHYESRREKDFIYYSFVQLRCFSMANYGLLSFLRQKKFDSSTLCIFHLKQSNISLAVVFRHQDWKKKQLKIPYTNLLCLVIDFTQSWFSPAPHLYSSSLEDSLHLFTIVPQSPGVERPSAQKQGLFYSQPTTERSFPCRIIGVRKKRKQVHDVQLSWTTPLFRNQPELSKNCWEWVAI